MDIVGSHRAAKVVLLIVVSVRVVGCLSVYLFDCQGDNSSTIRDIITKFSWHHPMDERADKFDSGYIAVHGWWVSVSDVLVIVSRKHQELPTLTKKAKTDCRGRPKAPPATQNSSQKSSGDKKIRKLGEVAQLKFGQLILRKIIKIVATICHILRLKCTKFDFGSRPSSWI